MKRFVVLLGAPGAGKGTQSQIIIEKLQLGYLSTGELFRAHLRDNTKIGLEIKEYLQRGELAPDMVTIRMVEAALKHENFASGALLDGFPRTIPQAEALMKIAAKYSASVRVIFIQVPEAELIARLSGRLTCRAGSHTFHRFLNPPKNPGRCDYDGSELYQREDDSEEMVTRRIQIYNAKTLPLLEYYRSQGVLTVLDGNRPISDVTANMLEAIRVAA